MRFFGQFIKHYENNSQILAIQCYKDNPVFGAYPITLSEVDEARLGVGISTRISAIRDNT